MMRSSDSSTKSGNSSASSSLSKEQAITIEPRDNDVLYGRGFTISNHPGNQRYRSLVCTLKSEYDVAPKVLKGVYSNRIVQSIYSLDPPGRFLRMNRSSGLWEEVDEDNACDKARQALRDAPPQEPHIAGGSTPSSTIFTHGHLLEEKLLAKSKQVSEFRPNNNFVCPPCYTDKIRLSGNSHIQAAGRRRHSAKILWR
jgi:hypothetical protein